LRWSLIAKIAKRTSVHALSTNNMKQQPAKFDPEQRRASARRTAWIVAVVAVAIYLLFFLAQGLSH